MIHRFQRQCQVNHWILNTCYIVGVQSIYISNEVTDRVTKYWPLFSSLVGRCIYWVISYRKSCLYLHFYLFGVIIMLIFSRNKFIICYDLKENWFACFLNLNSPTYHCTYVTYYIILYVFCLLILIQSLLFTIQQNFHMASSSIGPLLTWNIVYESIYRKIMLTTLKE